MAMHGCSWSGAVRISLMSGSWSIKGVQELCACSPVGVG